MSSMTLLTVKAGSMSITLSASYHIKLTGGYSMPLQPRVNATVHACMWTRGSVVASFNRSPPSTHRVRNETNRYRRRRLWGTLRSWCDLSMRSNYVPSLGSGIATTCAQGLSIDVSGSVTIGHSHTGVGESFSTVRDIESFPNVVYNRRKCEERGGTSTDGFQYHYPMAGCPPLQRVPHPDQTFWVPGVIRNVVVDLEGQREPERERVPRAARYHSPRRFG